MISKTISIQITDQGSTSAVISHPATAEDNYRQGVILAHGAANDMNHPLLVFLAEKLAEEGFTTLRFNFLYKDKGKKAPDSQAILVKTWQSVYNFFTKESQHQHFQHKIDKVIIAGKSMGGRVASQMVADELINPDALIFLGYPLHAPGKKEKLRDSHLYGITTPMLFFVGTRDPFCDLMLLNRVLGKLKSPWDLGIIEGGDHSFKLPEADSKKTKNINSMILKRSLQWLNTNFSHFD